jgi:hypothetical protein
MRSRGRPKRSPEEIAARDARASAKLTAAGQWHPERYTIHIAPQPPGGPHTWWEWVVADDRPAGPPSLSARQTSPSDARRHVPERSGPAGGPSDLSEHRGRDDQARAQGVQHQHPPSLRLRWKHAKLPQAGSSAST